MKMNFKEVKCIIFVVILCLVLWAIIWYFNIGGLRSEIYQEAII